MGMNAILVKDPQEDARDIVVPCSRKQSRGQGLTSPRLER